MRHLQTTHAEKVWKCSLCGLDYAAPTFSSKEGLEIHFLTTHDSTNDLTESQLPILLERSLKSQPFVITQCPICTRRETEVGDMFAHVAEELLEFALEALPWERSLLQSSDMSQAERSSSNISGEARADLERDTLASNECEISCGDDTAGETSIVSGEKRPLAILKSIFVSVTNRWRTYCILIRLVYRA